MRRIQLALVLLFIASSVSAQNARSAVSVSGSDLNTCTPASPCRSFAVAVGHTSPGGEVIALDSGGFGSFTATQAITVSGAPGVHASITATAGQGIEVNAGPADAMTLRNLVILNSGATNGIQIDAGASVHVSGCVIRGFNAGSGVLLNASVETEIDRVLVQNNGYGVSIGGNTAFRSRITNSQIDDNTAVGIDVVPFTRLLVADTSLTGNSIGVREVSNINGNKIDVTLDHVHVVGNNIGIFLSVVDANGDATVRLYGCVISYNVNAGIQGNGLASSYGNNAIAANNPDLQGIGLSPYSQQ